MKLDVVMPVRDEPATVGQLTVVLSRHPDICCVHVIIDADDIEHSAEEIPKADNVFIRMPPLTGKGQLLKHGLDYVGTERVIFIDSDLDNLQPFHIDALAQNNRPGMIIGIPDYPTELNPLEPGDIRAINAWPFVTGERSMPTSFARRIDLHGYLAEQQFINAARKAEMPIWMERLNGLKSPWRMTSRRLWEMDRDRKWGKEHGIL